MIGNVRGDNPDRKDVEMLTERCAVRRGSRAGAGRFGAKAAMPARRAVASVAVVLGMLSALMVTAGPALAASPEPGAVAGQALTFIPGKGTDTDPVYLVLPAPCPAEATSTLGTLRGKGFPADGINVVPTSKAGIQHQDPFGLPLQNALKNFAAMNGATFSGDYTFTVRCVDRLGLKTFATFSGTMTFTDPTHWVATKPATPPGYGVPVAILQWVYPELGIATPAPAEPAPGAALPSGDAQAAPSAAQGPAGAVASPSDGQSAVASGAPAVAGVASPAAAAGASSVALPAATTTGGSGSSPMLMVLGGVAVLLGVAYLVAKRRERQPSRLGSEPSADWPDEEHHKEHV